MAYSAGRARPVLTSRCDIEEVNRTDPTQFNRTFLRTNGCGFGGQHLHPTEHDTYKSDREIDVRDARRDGGARRHRAGRRALVIENDLRRLVGLCPGGRQSVRADTAPRLYCRRYRLAGGCAARSRANPRAARRSQLNP